VSPDFELSESDRIKNKKEMKDLAMAEYRRAKEEEAKAAVDLAQGVEVDGDSEDEDEMELSELELPA